MNSSTGLHIIIAMVCSLSFFGCGPAKTIEAPQVGRPLAELIAEKRAAYPELRSGVFVPLADFEDRNGEVGQEQLAYFSLVPETLGGTFAFTDQSVGTGKGAMSITLEPAQAMEFELPNLTDISNYSLLSFAMHCPARRDDLQITLISRTGTWVSPRTMVTPGKNLVAIDIARLAGADGFDTGEVLKIQLRFLYAVDPISVTLDDMLLVQNERVIADTPEGITLGKVGLNYTLALPSRPTLSLRQDAQGLWRIAPGQPTLTVTAPGTPLPEGEDLQRLGPHRIGQVTILENGPVRLRLRNHWYFPSRPGEWSTVGVREVRWDWTLYPDGLWVTDVLFNNAGGKAVGKLRLTTPQAVTWSTGERAIGIEDPNFIGPSSSWSFASGAGAEKKAQETHYATPGRIERLVGDEARTAAGDKNADGYDETQGCYVIAGKAGRCRFRFHPPADGIPAPVIRVLGDWPKGVTVSSQGSRLEPVQHLKDGSILFTLPGEITHPTLVEVAK